MSDVQTLSWLVALASIVIYMYLYGASQREDCPIVQDRFTALPVIVSLFFLMLSIYPRVIYATSITHTTFIFEEIGASIIYISKLISGEKTYSGATQIVFAVLMDWWRAIGGMSVAWARSLSAFIGIIGLPLYYLSFKRLLNKNIALLTTALIAAGLYSTFFSRLAIETGWVLTVLALNLFIFTHLKLHSRVRFYLFGLSIAAGVFTYPGYSLGLASIVLSLIATYALYRNKIILPTFANSWRPLLCALIGILTLAVPAAVFHFTQQSQAPFLFGGGVSTIDSISYLDSVFVQLHDIFVQSTSYYLPFSDYAFVEASLWGFFAIATWTHVFKKRSPFYLIILLTCITLPFFVAIAKNYPGMRRGVMFLTPFYLMSGTGLYIFISSIEHLKSVLKKCVAGAIILGVFALSTYTHYETQTSASRMRPYTPLNEILQYQDFRPLLEQYNVILIMDELDEFLMDYLKHNTLLMMRYAPSANDLTQSLHVQKSNEKLALRNDKMNLIISNNAQNILRYRFNKEICNIDSRQIKTIYFPFYASEAAPSFSSLCKAK